MLFQKFLSKQSPFSPFQINVMPGKAPIKGLINRTRSRSNSPKNRREKCVEDVCSSTSLPPGVEGPLRSLLKVEVPSAIIFNGHPREKLAVRLKWWGESDASDGTLFRPKIVYSKGVVVDNIGKLMPTVWKKNENC